MSQAVRRMVRMIDLGGGLACAAVLAATTFGALLPAFRHGGDAAARRGELIRQRQRVAAVKASIMSAQSQLAAAQAELARNPVRLDDVRQVNRRLARINELASGSGLNVRGVEPGGVTRGSRFQAVGLKVAGTGSYRDCVRFLHDLHDRMPDTAVTAFRLTGTPQEPSAAATFDFDLRWYAAPAAQSTASTASPE